VKVGDIYLLVGGYEFDQANEDIKWMNKYLPLDEQLPYQDTLIQVLIKFDHNLKVIFEHGYYPNHEGSSIAGVDCNLHSAMSIDMHDSVYLSQTFCNDDTMDFRAGKVFLHKFNWKCPKGTRMDWEDLLCLPDRLFCKCGFSVEKVSGIGVQCYQYIGNDFKLFFLEFDKMLKMDYPRLNYWAAVCVRSAPYEPGTDSETIWLKLLRKVEKKSSALRHASDAFSIVDGRYKARTRGSPPTFTHIHDDITSFIDDLQPLHSEIIHPGSTTSYYVEEEPTFFLPPEPTRPPLGYQETYAPTREPTKDPTNAPVVTPPPSVSVSVSEPLDTPPALILSFSWVVLSWELSNHLLPFMHNFGRNTMMLQYYLEMTSWNVTDAEDMVGEYIHNGLIQLFASTGMIQRSLEMMLHEVSRVLVDQQIRKRHIPWNDVDEQIYSDSVCAELQRQQRVLDWKVSLFRDRSKMYAAFALDDSIDWGSINELNDTVRDIQSLLFAQTMDFEEIARFLGSWYCSYSRYELLDEFEQFINEETDVCVPVQHLGGLNVVEKTEKIMRFIEALIPRVNVIKKEYGMKLTRTLMMDISDIVQDELDDARSRGENAITFTLDHNELMLMQKLQNIKILEIMMQFLNEEREPLDDLEFNVTLHSPFRVYQNGKEFRFRMNTYEMTAFHHKFNVDEFHQTPKFTKWFKNHVKGKTINEDGEKTFNVAPEHMLLLSDNTAIFNRFKFNKNLHLPSPFCQWTIEFNHDDHNPNTTANESAHASYGSEKLKQVRHIKIGFFVVADPIPEEFQINLTEQYPDLQV